MKPPRLKVNIEKRLDTFNLSVQIEVGAEILVLFGPSGAGKTQTLNAIAGLMTLVRSRWMKLSSSAPPAL